MAELADALDSGSSESNFIWVQVPSSAPNKSNPNEFWLLLFYVNFKGLDPLAVACNSNHLRARAA